MQESKDDGQLRKLWKSLNTQQPCNEEPDEIQ